MVPAIRNWTRDEMMKRLAFFRDLKGSKTGLPDSDLPGMAQNNVPLSTSIVTVIVALAIVANTLMLRAARRFARRPVGSAAH